MKKTYIIILVILVLFFSFAKSLSHSPSYSSGISGVTTGAACGNCHSGGLGNVTVNLTGVPVNPVVGNTYALVLSVSGPNVRAGFDLAASSGTLSPGSGSILLNSELTHSSPRLKSNSVPATWNVNWTATSAGAVNFTFAGADVNNNGAITGDSWATGTAFTNAVVPIKLISFNAVLNNKYSADLTWKVAEEINVKWYIIERSCDGIIYKPVGTVNKSSNNVPKTYNYIDASINCSAEKIFYRLKTEDIDGRFEYSPIAAMLLPNTDNPYLYPNPVSKSADKIMLFVGKQNPQTIQLYSSTGILINTYKSVSPYKNELTLPGNMKAGYYYFKINYQKTKKTVKFILE